MCDPSSFEFGINTIGGATRDSLSGNSHDVLGNNSYTLDVDSDNSGSSSSSAAAAAAAAAVAVAAAAAVQRCGCSYCYYCTSHISFVFI